jgi:hypothetical protein
MSGHRIRHVLDDDLGPSTTFVLLLVVAYALLVVWPLVQALRSGRYWWAVLIVLTTYLGGILWFAFRRRQR